jgi:hypothetical protein
VKREPTDQERLCRLALLEARRIDKPHPTMKGARVVGYVIEPDELYGEGEGVALMHALERSAGLDLETVRARLTGFICE